MKLIEKVKIINKLVSEYEDYGYQIYPMGRGNTHKRVKVSCSVVADMKSAIFYSYAAYKVFYSNGRNSYNVYISRGLADYIAANFENELKKIG